MKVTYYLEVLSSWCHWVEPVWNELKIRCAGRVEFGWKIALMNPRDFPVSRAQCDWFHQRSGGTVMRSLYKLNSAWLEPGRRGRYDAPNLVAEAGREFGIEDDDLRLALTDAALRRGLKIGDLATAVKIAAQAGKIDPKKLRKAAESKAVKSRVAASTAEFVSHRITQRPAFVLANALGDKAVFSGLVRIEPLVATIDAMLADTAAYASHRAHHGLPPGR